MKESIASYVLNTQTLIHNAANNSRLQGQLKEYGYNSQRIQEATDLLENFKVQQNEQEALYNDQKERNRQLKVDMATLRASYREHLAVARFAFRHDMGKQSWLELEGLRKSSAADFLMQVQKFYQRVEPLVPQLKKHGAVAEEFAQSKAQVAAVMALRQQRVNGKGEAEQATQLRNEAYQALETWLSGFKQVARAAFREQPQLLESLGIKKRS